MGKSRITVNGVTIEAEGNNVSVRNGTIYVDGNVIVSELSGEVHVIWHGSLASLDAGGSVTCQHVYGDVNAGGSVHCRQLPTEVNQLGKSSCAVGGSINAGGSVHIR